MLRSADTAVRTFISKMGAKQGARTKAGLGFIGFRGLLHGFWGFGVSVFRV